MDVPRRSGVVVDVVGVISVSEVTMFKIEINPMITHTYTS
jgi:hypothetical protein